MEMISLLIECSTSSLVKSGLTLKKQEHLLKNCLHFVLTHFIIFIAPAYSKVRYRGSTFHPFVRSFVRPSTIYVKVLTL